MRQIFGFLIVFLAGFILGEMETKLIINRVSEEISKMDIVSIIGLISSITTLLVFLMYIFGKIYAIKKAEMFLTESFFIESDPEKTVNFNVVKEVYLEKDFDEKIYLIPNEPIREISFYTYDWEKNDVGVHMKSSGSLKIGEVLCIYTNLPGGIPNYVVKYKRFDYVEGTLVLAYDGKGLTKYKTPEIKHTWRSYFYHLVKA